MKKKLLFVALLLICCAFIPQEENTIVWKKGLKLLPADFRSLPVAGSSDKAWSKVGLEMPYTYSGTELTYKCICKFYKDGSWMVDSSMRILKHEQGHFDIAEVCARHVRRIFESYKGKTIDFESLNTQLKGALDEMDSLEQLYDAETHHSVNEKMQALWYRRIVDSLNTLSKYSTEQGKIKFKYK